MNATIEKIIGLLFEDLEENDEVRAIYEEVCLNCQERYQDKLALGLSEDEAIHAVVESLSGMEEMLRPYPRKKIVQEEKQAGEGDSFFDSDDEEDEAFRYTLDPTVSPVRVIRAVRLGSTDVQLCASSDGLVHVECEEDTMPVLVQLQGDTLVIELKTEAGAQSSSDSSRTAGEEAAGDGLFSAIDKLFNGLFRISCGGGTLSISVPGELLPVVKIDTASGDFTADSVCLAELHANTASGDIRLSDASVRSLRLSTTSGDLHLEHVNADALTLTSTSGDLHAEHVSVSELTRVNTTSGDVHWYGDSHALEVTTISGDLNRVEGCFAQVQFKTVSGDVQLSVMNDSLLSLHGKTTSGDQRVRLCGPGSCHIQCRSVSGDVHNALACDPQSPVKVELTSVSGDISIR